jgi:transposase
MKSYNSFDMIYIHKDPIDFRKGIYGLVGLIQDEMTVSPFQNYLFLFTNKYRDRVKFLYWDKTGFALWYKILEKNRYAWPLDLECEVLVASKLDIKKFLTGLNPWERPHEKLLYKFA